MWNPWNGGAWKWRFDFCNLSNWIFLFKVPVTGQVGSTSWEFSIILSFNQNCRCFCGCFLFLSRMVFYQGTCGWVQESHVHHPRWSYHVVHRHSSESRRWIDIHTSIVVNWYPGRRNDDVPPFAGLLNMDSNSEFVNGWARYIPSKKTKIVRPWEQDGKSENHHLQKCRPVRDMWSFPGRYTIYNMLVRHDILAPGDIIMIETLCFCALRKQWKIMFRNKQTHTSTFIDVRLQTGHLLYWSSCLFRSLWPKPLSKMYCEDVCGKGKA